MLFDLLAIIFVYVFVVYMAYTENKKYYVLIGGEKYKAVKQGEKLKSKRLGAVKHIIKYDNNNNMYVNYFGVPCKVITKYQW